MEPETKAQVQTGTKVGLFSGAAMVLSTVVAQVFTICPDLKAQLPVIVVSGLMAGVGLWLKSPRSK